MTMYMGNMNDCDHNDVLTAFRRDNIIMSYFYMVTLMWLLFSQFLRTTPLALKFTALLWILVNIDNIHFLLLVNSQQSPLFYGFLHL